MKPPDRHKLDVRAHVRTLLEPGALERASVAPEVVAISTAISLKRLADALQPVNVKAETMKVALHRMGENEPAVDFDTIAIESLAGNHLNITDAEVDAMSTVETKRLIRGLCSAVLRKAEK